MSECGVCKCGGTLIKSTYGEAFAKRGMKYSNDEREDSTCFLCTNPDCQTIYSVTAVRINSDDIEMLEDAGNSLGRYGTTNGRTQ